MTNQNSVCKNIIDTQDVIKTQVLATLAETLVASNTITKDQFNELSKRVSSCVDSQMGSLIDRVLHEFQK
jgi:hypothetical protein